MNDAYISALAALAGSGIGALASTGTTWLTQRHQARSQRLAQISARLEQVFGEFIDQASRLFADALTHQLDDPTKLVPLYATMGKLRLYASNATVVCADRVMSRILDAYYSPNINFETQRIENAENYDVLRAFITACQTELKGYALRKMTQSPAAIPTSFCPSQDEEAMEMSKRCGGSTVSSLICGEV
jgi:hypothetical protein